MTRDQDLDLTTTKTQLTLNTVPRDIVPRDDHNRQFGCQKMSIQIGVENCSAEMRIFASAK